MIAAGDDTGRISIWNLTDFSLVQSLRDSDKLKVQGLEWAHPDRDSSHVHAPVLCIAAMRRGTLQAWLRQSSTSEFKYIKNFRALPDGELESVALSSTNVLAVTGCGFLGLFRVVPDSRDDPFRPMKVIQIGKDVVPVTFINHENSVLVGAPKSRTLHAYNLRSGEIEWSRQILTRIGHFAWSDETGHLAVHNLKDGIDVYKVVDQDLHLVIHLSMEERARIIKHVDFLPDGASVVAGGDDGHVRLWKVPKGIELSPLSHGSTNNPAQLVKATIGLGGEIYIASATTGPSPMLRVWRGASASAISDMFGSQTKMSAEGSNNSHRTFLRYRLSFMLQRRLLKAVLNFLLVVSLFIVLLVSEFPQRVWDYFTLNEFDLEE